jgi:hypothetical protein
VGRVWRKKAAHIIAARKERERERERERTGTEYNFQRHSPGTTSSTSKSFHHFPK